MIANFKRDIHGVLLLDKPLGISSNAALQQAKRLYQAKKAGHTGTLDPLATGLLPLCFGEATKFSQDLLEADKTYQATIKLGVRTATGDAEGVELERREVKRMELKTIEMVLQKFVGPIVQIPPLHSAIKYQGIPLYVYARAQKEVPQKPRQVTIFSIVLESFKHDELNIKVKCSKGTYIRTLAEDIGKELGCGAHLLSLRRTHISNLNLESAVTIDWLLGVGLKEKEAALLPVDVLTQSLPSIKLELEQILRLQQGQIISMRSEYRGRVRVYALCSNKFFGIAEIVSDNAVIPKRLIAEKVF